MFVGAALAAILFFPFASVADTMDEEINYLLNAVGESACTFIRNGKGHSARDARAHLNSKRRRNADLFDSAEVFIEKIASKSSMSGQPYLIRCKGKDQQTAAEWFTNQLAQYRQTIRD